LKLITFTGSALESLYKECYASAKRELRKDGCSSFDFDDLYQDSFLILADMQKGSRKPLRHPYTYIIRICQSLWLKGRKRRELYEPTEKMDEFQNPESETNDDILHLLETHQNRLSATCQQILNLYYDGYSEDEICKILGFSDRKVVNNKKRYCKERLRLMIINDPLFNELNG